MSNHIFKAYDIRGKYPSEINEDFAYRLGGAIAEYFAQPKIVVARDHRTSSPSLRDALVSGITDQGVEVIDVGLASTPMAYFASHHFALPVAMITASHNPPEYNGVKISNVNAVAVGLGSGLEHIRDIVEKKSKTKSKVKGTSEEIDIAGLYEAFIHKQSPKLSGTHRIVTDTASAMGILELYVLSTFAPHVDIVHKLYPTFEEPCPHEANPMKGETLIELGAAVRKHHAALGIAYDGDADRIGVVDENGTPVRADHLTALIGEAMLNDYPESTILADVRSSRAVKEHLSTLGGTVIECPVGHAKIKAMMKETGAIFAGELSSHFYFAEPYMAEMGSLPLLCLLSVIEQKGVPLSQLVKHLPTYAQSGELNFTVSRAQELLQNIRETYADGALSEIDGIKIDYPNWWLSLRTSNTEPLVRLNVEATDGALLATKTEELKKIISSFS